MAESSQGGGPVREAIRLTLAGLPDQEQRTSVSVYASDRERMTALADKLGWTRHAVVRAGLSLLEEAVADADSTVPAVKEQP